MSPAAFLNYLDCDIRNPARAYWGSNLERLVTVKQTYDPDNVFRHAMSVPVRLENDASAAATRRLVCGEA